MTKEKTSHIILNILKKTVKWLLILLAIVCAILVLVAVYLLVLEFFYDGESMSAFVKNGDLALLFSKK